MDIVRRKLLLVTVGTFRVKEEKTIGELSTGWMVKGLLPRITLDTNFVTEIPHSPSKTYM